ncbi:MAG TPA: hypothetical protein VHY57_02715, partial [Rhizomicrobium sp.]|nr:hypothetical protein [Rhizomicrobium sp.]
VRPHAARQGRGRQQGGADLKSHVSIPFTIVVETSIAWRLGFRLALSRSPAVSLMSAKVHNAQVDFMKCLHFALPLAALPGGVVGETIPVSGS